MDIENIKLDDITVYIQRKKVKNINLRINKKMQVIVSANSKTDIKVIEKFIHSKSLWIKNSLYKMNKIYINNLVENNQQFIDGEKIKIYGEQYILNFIQSDQNTVNVNGYLLNIHVNDKSNCKVKEKTINDFFMKMAIEDFNFALDKVFKTIQPFVSIKPKLSIKKMKSRWGSCDIKNKKITINYELIKSPKECLDFVILHELVHFLEKGHNDRFYSLLSTFMPDWKNKKKILDKEYSII